MEVIVNGETRKIEPQTTAIGLVESLGLDPGRVVVEVNRKILKRDQLPRHSFESGDQIEILHFVGGG